MSKKFKKDMFDLSVDEQQKLANNFENLIDNGLIGMYDVRSGMCNDIVDEDLAALIEDKAAKGQIGSENIELNAQTVNNNRDVEVFALTDDEVIANITTSLNPDTGNIEIMYQGKIINQIAIPEQSSSDFGQYDSEEESYDIDELDEDDETDGDDEKLTTVCIDYDNDNEIVTVTNDTTVFSVDINKLPKFVNDIHNETTLLHEVFSEFIIKNLPKFIPTAVFRKKDFISQIARVIKDYDSEKFYFYEHNDFILCYILDNTTMLKMDDIIDDTATEHVTFTLLDFIETMMSSDVYITDTNNATLTRFLTSSKNQTLMLQNILFDDPLTTYAEGVGSYETLPIYNLKTHEFKYIEFLDRVRAKMHGANTDTAKSTPKQQTPSKPKSKITKIESDSSNESEESQ